MGLKVKGHEHKMVGLDFDLFVFRVTTHNSWMDSTIKVTEVLGILFRG